MKQILIILALFYSSITLSKTLEIKIQDIADKVSKGNFKVLANAERVYQRKEKIKFSRASLLPKLNLWNLLKIPALIIDPLGVGDILQDVAPFLVPANWFKVRQSKELFYSEQEQYRALWANEVNTAKLLFMSVQRDIDLQNLIGLKSKKYKELLDIAESRNIFGEGNIFAYNLIKDSYLSLKEDSRNLDQLIYREVKDLQFLIGIGSEEDVKIIALLLSNIDEAHKIEFSKIIFKVIDASPEVKQYEYMFNALSKVKGEIFFSVLGTSTYSNGNGAFDNIPVQDGLGFGRSASIRISKSEGRVLKIQLQATLETLKRQTNVLVNEYNSLLENLDIAKQRITLSKANYTAMMDYISIGGEIDPLEMTEILNNLFSSKVLLLSYKYRFADLVEKLNRMTFSGDYKNNPTEKDFGISLKLKEVAMYFTLVKSHLDKLEFSFSMENLKSYSDSLGTIQKYLIPIMKKKRSMKRVRKYLGRNGFGQNICQEILMSKKKYEEVLTQCQDGFFNSCPLSFTHLQINKEKLILNLKKIFNGQSILNARCDNLYY